MFNGLHYWLADTWRTVNVERYLAVDRELGCLSDLVVRGGGPCT